jgi:cytochrome oxidase Cu insertion factor (SCO1/SenC/PrrC family)
VRPTPKRAATIGFVLAGALVTAAVASSVLPASERTSAGPSGASPAGTVVHGTVPDVRLADQTGRRVSMTDFRGRYLVLAPSMTVCRTTCRRATAVLREVDAAVRRDIALHGRVVVATATVDPWRDNPARLRAYRRRTGVRFATLTGSGAKLRRLWRFFGVYYARTPAHTPPERDWLTGRPETFGVAHTESLFILDPRGRWRVRLPGSPVSAASAGDRTASNRTWSATDVLGALQALRAASQLHPR